MHNKKNAYIFLINETEKPVFETGLELDHTNC
jgi:hypothetical protein